jgi:hypothetical protein
VRMAVTSLYARPKVPQTLADCQTTQGSLFAGFLRRRQPRIEEGC